MAEKCSNLFAMRASLTSRATIAALALLLLVACGGRTSDGNAALQGQAGGASSTGGATTTGLTSSTGGDLSTGGTSSTNTSIVGCPGQPVAKPPAFNAGSSGDCGSSQGQGPVVLGGIYATALETFDVSFASTCVYPAPACTPLIAFTSSLGYADPNNLSVWFSFPDGTAEMYPSVMSAADCTTSGGFYLDSIETNPTTITFCPCTCDRLGSIQGTIYVIDFPVIVVD